MFFKRLFFSIVLLIGNFCTAQTVTIERKRFDTLSDSVSIEAEFPGGNKALAKFLEKEINVDVPDSNHAPAGEYKVIVKFIIDENGYVTETTPDKNFGYGMENEVMRALKKLPKWRPLNENGKFKKAYRSISITFFVYPNEKG